MDLNKDLSREDIIKQYSNILYKTSNSIFGSEYSNIKNEEIKGLNGKFTSHLSQAGMWRNNGLNCTKDKERFVKGSNDWMDNLS